MRILEDHSERFAARCAFESAGCAVVGIDGARNGLQVRIKRGAFAEVLAVAGRMGATVTDLHYFPIGSDKVADEFRHDGSYPGSRGFVSHALVILPS